MTQLSRRQFSTRTLLLGLLSTLPMTLFGCSVFSDISAWIPVAVSAINGIVTVLGTLMPPGAQQAISLTLAALASLSGAINEYNSDTNSADKATLLAKIRTFLADVGTNFQSFLSQLNLGTNPIVNVVLGLAQVILSAIMGFLGQLPPAPAASSTSTLSAVVRVSNKSLTITPKFYKHVGDFKKDYNTAAAAAGHPEIEIK